MLVETWGDVLRSSFQDMWRGVAHFVPNFVIAIIIFIAGWVIAVVIGKLIAQVIRSLKIDNLFRSLGTEEALNRAGIKLDIGAFIGALIKWFVIVVFLVAAINVLGLAEVNIFLREVVLSYLPNVIAAALILILAAVIADVVQRLVTGSAKAAQIPSAGFMGGIARWAIWIFAILAALAQLGIAQAFMQILFTGLVAMLAIAGGLSFGLGGKETAARYLDRLRKDITDR